VPPYRQLIKLIEHMLEPRRRDSRRRQSFSPPKGKDRAAAPGTPTMFEQIRVDLRPASSRSPDLPLPSFPLAHRATE
jgi:hypothetical protein